jgi:hypothetical protein
MGAASITNRWLSAISRPQHLCRPHSIAEARPVVDATIAKDDGSARRLHPPIPALRHRILRRLEIDLNSPVCPKTSSRKRRTSTPLPPTPDVDLPAALATLFADDTAAARLHEPTDWSSRPPFLFLLPPVRRRSRPSLRRCRHCHRHTGRRNIVRRKRRRNPRRTVDFDRTSARRVHGCLHRCGHLCPDRLLGMRAFTFVRS